jgi:hypothetical protein
MLLELKGCKQSGHSCHVAAIKAVQNRMATSVSSMSEK